MCCLPPRLSTRAVLWLAVAAVVLPIFADLLLGGREGPFRYLAPDAFYYNTVARNIAEIGVISFDGTLPTNGFHPLWQAILAALYRLSMLTGGSEVDFLVSSVLVGAVMIAASLALLGLAAERSGRRLTTRFLWMPVGPYALLLLPLWIWAIDIRGLVQWAQGPHPLFGTLWSYVNGMESAVLLLAFSGLGWVFVTREEAPVRSAAALGGLAATLSLARLDHIFFALMFPLFHAARALGQRRRQEWIELFACGLSFGLPLVFYLLANQLYAGTPMPVSGALKSSFPIPSGDNLANLWILVSQPADEIFLARLFRSAQVLIPAGVALVFLAREWTKSERPDAFGTFLRLTAGGVLLLAAYNFFFVRAFAMGHWYTPVSVCFVSLVLLIPMRRRGTVGPTNILPWRPSLIAILVLGIFLGAHRRSDYHWLFAKFYFDEAPLVRAFYAKRGPPPQIIEVDDGLIAFATRFPTISGTGLMLDVEAATALRQNRFGPLALARGYRRASSLAYMTPKGVRQGPGKLGVEVSVSRVELYRQSWPLCPWQAEYISPSGNALFVHCPNDIPATPEPATPEPPHQILEDAAADGKAGSSAPLSTHVNTGYLFYTFSVLGHRELYSATERVSACRPLAGAAPAAGVYSLRITSIGWTRLARHAGNKQARDALLATRKKVPPKVSGSQLSTAYSRLVNIRLKPRASRTPTPDPTRVSHRPILSTRPKMFFWVAPRVIRMPNSKRRLLTTKDTTPKIPNMASRSAKMLNNPNNAAM